MQYQPDNVYMNVFFNNFTTGTSTNSIPAIYQQTKDSSYLDEPGDYYAAIVRGEFAIDSVPIMNMAIVPNQGNPNLTPYQISVDGFTQSVTYNPDNNLTAPVQNSAAQIITPYYEVYSISNLLDSINVALSTAFAAAGSPGGGTVPYYIFDPVSEFIKLIVSQAFVNGGNIISVNYDLLSFLPGFRYTAVANNQFNYILTSRSVREPCDAFGLVTAAGPNFLFTQQYRAIQDWLSLRRIIVTSSTLPINKEYVPVKLVSGGQVYYSNQASSIPIVADFVPQFDDLTKSTSYYIPAAQYRLIDMSTNTPQNKINFEIFWEDKFGNIFPLNLSRNSQCSLKIGFFKKNLYSQIDKLIK